MDRSGQRSVYNPDHLRRQTRWIRDELDVTVARHGPDALCSDDLLKLDDFLRSLLTSDVGINDIRYSRIHCAILEIVGCGTRWPKRIIDRCESLEAELQARHGPLKGYGFPLYETGGRLHGLCEPEDASRPERLLVRWLKIPGGLNPFGARRTGDLGFKPGE